MKRTTMVWACAVVAVAGLAAAQELTLVAKDPEGHGALYRVGAKRVLVVDGTPEQTDGRGARTPLGRLGSERDAAHDGAGGRGTGGEEG